MNSEINVSLDVRTPKDILIFADNMTMFIMNQEGVPWTMIFTEEELYREFCYTDGPEILFYFVSTMEDWEFSLQNPRFWRADADAFRKSVHKFKELAKQNRYEKVCLLNYALHISYAGQFFYKSGLSHAPLLAFLEIVAIARIMFPNGEISD
ncbi:hypothetical protein CDAR_434981 [Caerostris darwini]|uniref:Uncharacterized protein n=1 Tax=Caerostris darwini TaxID=1538125 RepID=A0AAV4QDC5_9ARAC|nr:hypothetical protein CDAR_434981 [Caerostris darwini]